MSLMLTALLLFTMISCAEPDNAENLPPTPSETILTDVKVVVATDISDGLSENDTIELKITKDNKDLTAEEAADYDIYYTVDGITDPSDKDEMKYDPTKKIAMPNNQLIIKAKAYVKADHTKMTKVTTVTIPLHNNVLNAYHEEKILATETVITPGQDYAITLKSDKDTDKIEYKLDNGEFVAYTEPIIINKNFTGDDVTITITGKVNGVVSDNVFTIKLRPFKVDLSNKGVTDVNNVKKDTEIQFWMFVEGKPVPGGEMKNYDIYYTTDGVTEPTDSPEFYFDYKNPNKMPTHDLTVKAIASLHADHKQHSKMMTWELKADPETKTDSAFIAYAQGKELNATTVLDFNEGITVTLKAANNTALQYSLDDGSTFVDYTEKGITIPAEAPETAALTKNLKIKIKDAADDTAVNYAFQWYAYKIDLSNKMTLPNPEPESDILFHIFGIKPDGKTFPIQGNQMSNWDIHYTLDGSDPDNTSALYDFTAAPKMPNEITTVKAIAYHKGVETAKTAIFSTSLTPADPVAKAYISGIEGDKELNEFTTLTANEELVVTLKAPGTKTIQYSLNNAEFVEYTEPIKIKTATTELISLRTQLMELGASSIREYTFKIPAEITEADNKLFITQVMNAGYNAKYIVLQNMGTEKIALCDYTLKVDTESEVLTGTLDAGEKAIIWTKGTNNYIENFIKTCPCAVKIKSEVPGKFAPKKACTIELLSTNNVVLDIINHEADKSGNHISYVREYANPISKTTGAYRFDAKQFQDVKNKLIILEYNAGIKEKLNSLLKTSAQIK